MVFEIISQIIVNKILGNYNILAVFFQNFVPDFMVGADIFEFFNPGMNRAFGNPNFKPSVNQFCRLLQSVS